MGKATIISHLGDGIYEIDYFIDPSDVDLLIARYEAISSKMVSRLADQQVKIEEANNSLQTAYSTLSSAISTGDTNKIRSAQGLVAEMSIKYELEVLRYMQLEAIKIEADKKAQYLTDNRPESINMIIPCADMASGEDGDAPELSGDVGTIEIASDPDLHIVIMPAFDVVPAYSASYGAAKGSLTLTPWAAAYAYAMMDGVQKWRPTYKAGRISNISVSLNTCTVVLDELLAETGDGEYEAQSLNVYEFYDNCPIDYMDCDAQAFLDDDHVIVAFDFYNNETPPTVIGFYDAPRKCPHLMDIQICYASEFSASFYYLTFNPSTELFEITSGTKAGAYTWIRRKDWQVVSCIANWVESNLLGPIDKNTYIWKENAVYLNGVKVTVPAGVMPVSAALDVSNKLVLFAEYYDGADQYYTVLKRTEPGTGGSWVTHGDNIFRDNANKAPMYPVGGSFDQAGTQFTNGNRRVTITDTGWTMDVIEGGTSNLTVTPEYLLCVPGDGGEAKIAHIGDTDRISVVYTPDGALNYSDVTQHHHVQEANWTNVLQYKHVQYSYGTTIKIGSSVIQFEGGGAATEEKVGESWEYTVDDPYRVPFTTFFWGGPLSKGTLWMHNDGSSHGEGTPSEVAYNPYFLTTGPDMGDGGVNCGDPATDWGVTLYTVPTPFSVSSDLVVLETGFAHGAQTLCNGAWAMSRNTHLFLSTGQDAMIIPGYDPDDSTTYVFVMGLG